MRRQVHEDPRKSMPSFLTRKGGAPYRLHSIGRKEYYEVPIHSGKWRHYHDDAAEIPKEVKDKLLKLFPPRPTPKTNAQILAEQSRIIAENERKIEEQKKLLEQNEKKPAVVVQDKVEKIEAISDVEAKAKAQEKVDEEKRLANLQEKTAKSSFAAEIQSKASG